MKFEIPAVKKLVFEMSIPIRWGDMDAMNHVNNTTYFRYLEIIRIEWFRSIGCMMDPLGEGPVIVNAFCNFYKQLEFPGDLLVRMYASDPARTTFETWATIERADAPGAIWAAGGATTIWVDFPKQKAVPLARLAAALVRGVSRPAVRVDQVVAPPPERAGSSDGTGCREKAFLLEFL
jgi:acyl-CoA thioester hydrolase